MKKSSLVGDFFCYEVLLSQHEIFNSDIII